MAKLTVFVDSGVRSSLARARLQELGIQFDEVNVAANREAADFLIAKGRPTTKYPLPQYYVGDTLAWEDFKEVNQLTAEQINQRIEEINASK